MYCNRLNFRSTWICAYALIAKRNTQTAGRTCFMTRQTNAISSIKIGSPFELGRSLLSSFAVAPVRLPRVAVHPAQLDQGDEMLSEGGNICSKREGSA